MSGSLRKEVYEADIYCQREIFEVVTEHERASLSRGIHTSDGGASLNPGISSLGYMCSWEKKDLKCAVSNDHGWWPEVVEKKESQHHQHQHQHQHQQRCVVVCQFSNEKENHM